MSSPIRVLIVENVPDDAELSANALRQAGFEPEVQRVETEREMREALDRSKWDLILLDYALPTFSGTKALKVCQEKGCEAPIIIVSGSVGEETAVEMMKQGADDYVMKDKLVRLPAAVRRALSDAKCAVSAASRRKNRSGRRPSLHKPIRSCNSSCTPSATTSKSPFA